MRIEIVVFDGFDELDAIGPLEVIGLANGGDVRFDVVLVGVEGPGEIVGNHGTRLVVETGLGLADQPPDAVIVPGGGWLTRSETGAWAQARQGVLPARLAELAPSLTWIASVCTGAMLLASAGLLTGRTATTNRNAQDELRAEGVSVMPNRVVDDGNVITAGGLTAGLDLGLWIIEREIDAATAQKVATSLEYRPENDVWQAVTLGADVPM